MSLRWSFARRQAYQESHPWITSRLVAPPGGFLVKSSQGWLHHRPRWGFRRHDRTNWETECGSLLLHGAHGQKPVFVAMSEVDFVCGRCELIAIEAGLPSTTLLSEGVCEAKRNLVRPT